MRHFLLLLLLLVPIGAGSLALAAPPASEQARIDALLDHVSGLSDATFVRNGKDYDAKSAAKFLRKKGEANEKNIRTAEDFIKIAATKSSTTGKPYLIRFKGGNTQPCGEYLLTRLQESGKSK